MTLSTVSVLILSACSGTKGTDTRDAESAATPSAAVPAAAEGDVGPNGPWVQDLWLYEAFVTFDDDGAEVDLTAEVLAGLEDPSRSVELPEGAVFHVHDALAATVTTNGVTRGDVDVVAGVLEYDGDRAPAALATPAPDATRPVGEADDVELDVSFLGDRLTPGDVLLADFAFLQARPAADEEKAGGPELLAARLTAGRGFYYGQEVDGGGEALSHAAVLGEAVPGSTRTSVAGKPDVSGPLLDSIRRGLTCTSAPIRCVKKYFEEVGEGARSSDQLLRCNLGPCDDPKPTPSCVGLGCHPTTEVRGDPHLTSFDGLRLSMQGVGEYVVTRTPGVDVQMRTAPVNPTTRTASGVTAVAVGGEDDQVVIDVDDQFVLRVWVGGTELPYDPTVEFTTTSTHGDLEVVREGDLVQVTAADGTVLLARHTFRNWLDLGVTPPKDREGLTGLLGNGDGNPDDDWTARDGSVVTTDTAGRALYTAFSDTWRVTEDESILRYGPGESTETYTDLSFPDRVVTVADLDPADRRRAEAACRAVGVRQDPLLGECVLDYALSGEIGFLGSAQNAARHLGSGSGPGQPAPGASSGWELTSGSPDAPTGALFRHDCEAGGTLRRVWGGNNGVYTDDSSICTAAVHAGLLTVAAGGSVEVTRTPGLDDYGQGTTRNGVTTTTWEKPWGGSFTLAP